MPRTSRKTLYDKPSVKLCTGDQAITVNRAKELLHWQEEPEDATFENDYLLRDRSKRKVRCHNNIRNRPFYRKIAEKLAQEILRGNWHFNMEPIIIGLTGLIISGQHRLIALILAVDMFNEDRDAYPFWESEPTLNIIINFGCSEEDEVVNTIDTGKPRSLGDVLYRSDHLKGFKAVERKRVARMIDYAVRLLWVRTEADPDNPVVRTHSESMNFVERHPRILPCVEHVLEEESGKEKRLSRLMSPGALVGFMYLMASSKTDPDVYHEERNEENINFDLWDKASDFVVLLATSDKAIRGILTAIGNLEGGGSFTERSVIIINGWHHYVAGTKITAANVKPKYIKTEDGFMTVTDAPVVGGIDAGTT